jgi:23S rRNA pseudouridine955/2504/2580 synthase
VRVPPVREAEPVVPGAPPRVPPGLIRAVERAIIHEDERLLVLDKPAGLAVHGGSGLSFGVIEALRASRPAETLELCHRLDRDTSGCLLIARRGAALRTLHALLRQGSVQKKYLTLLSGRWKLGRERTVKVDERGKEALTEFKPVQHYGSRATLMEVTLRTGRTHQIRVHAAWCGHPVLGDEKYGAEAANAELASLGLHRMFLHAHSLAFSWPGGGAESFSAPLPAELHAVLDRL